MCEIGLYYICIYDAAPGAETATNEFRITSRGSRWTERGCWTGELSYLGFEEVDGDAVVLQTVDSQFATVGRRQRLLGDELQQSNQSDSGLQLSVDVSQLQPLLQDMRTEKD